MNPEDRSAEIDASSQRRERRVGRQAFDLRPVDLRELVARIRDVRLQRAVVEVVLALDVRLRSRWPAGPPSAPRRNPVAAGPRGSPSARGRPPASPAASALQARRNSLPVLLLSLPIPGSRSLPLSLLPASSLSARSLPHPLLSPAPATLFGPLSRLPSSAARASRTRCSRRSGTTRPAASMTPAPTTRR